MGHFLIAKKLGVKVEEFGIGYPPRIVGKKIGETLYSLNLLPFGGFVKIVGEEEKIKEAGSFSERPLWQRISIVLGGTISFWLISFLIFTFLSAGWGFYQSVPDDFSGPAQIQIVQVAKNSPAQKAGIKPGDIIEKAKFDSQIWEVNKIKEFQEFINLHQGEKISLILKRGKEEKIAILQPRISPPPREGRIGVGLIRVTRIKFPWYQAPWQGAKITFEKTIQIPILLFAILKKALRGERVEGFQFMGPIGIGSLMSEVLKTGWGNFLMFLALISLWLALINLFPIPALDGGKLLFLLLEGVRKKPIPKIVEQKITTFFFLLLIFLMILVTLKDIMRLF